MKPRLRSGLLVFIWYMLNTGGHVPDFFYSSLGSYNKQETTPIWLVSLLQLLLYNLDGS